MKTFFVRLYCIPVFVFIAILVWYFTSYNGSFKSLWITNDQQAYRYFTNGKFEKAAATFEDMRFKAAALYRDKNFKSAQQLYQPMNDAISHYNRGNCLVMYGQYAQAKSEYQQALVEKPDFRQAKENLDIALKLLSEQEYIAQHTEAKKKAKGETVSLSTKEKHKEKKKQPKEKGKKQKMTVPGTALWLDRLHTGPKDFLKQKFSYQYQKEEENNEK